MLKVIVRTVVMYIFVTVSVRLMGKRQIGDMQPTELVVTLLISEIAAIPLQDVTQPISIGALAIFMLVLLEILASVIIMKNLRLRRIFSGRAVSIIKNGIIDQKAMRSVRITVFDLVEMLRMQGIFNIEDVESAFLEVNGSLSVRQKPDASPATPKQLGVTVTDSGVPLTVISDGTVVDASLRYLSITRDDLNMLLKKKNKSASDVFLMTLNKSGESVIIDKEKKK